MDAMFGIYQELDQEYQCTNLSQPLAVSNPLGTVAQDRQDQLVHGFRDEVAAEEVTVNQE
jgi:hypothetical protein